LDWIIALMLLAYVQYSDVLSIIFVDNRLLGLHGGAVWTTANRAGKYVNPPVSIAVIIQIRVYDSSNNAAMAVESGNDDAAARY